MIIVHRCSCGHPDIYHQHPQVVDNGGRCCNGECKARTHELGVPELLATFVDGVRNEYVYPPGDQDCLALYAQVKNDAIPLRPWYFQESA